MALPTYQDVMLPLLQAATDQETKISDAIERLAQTYQLSEAEYTQILPSGRQTVFTSRVSKARTYLRKAGLLATPGEDLSASPMTADSCWPPIHPESITIRSCNS